MSNEIKPIQPADIALNGQSPVPMSFTQTGNNGTQIGRAETVNNEIHVSVYDTSTIKPDGTIQRTSTQLSSEYYSLFVLGTGEPFEGIEGSFIVRGDRVLERGYTDEEIRDAFIYLTDADRETIKSYPALFMSENHDYGRTDEGQMAYWGRVTAISPHGKDTKIRYRFIKEIPQQKLNGLLEELCLLGANCFNELNRTHWAIKRVNLFEELTDAHIDLF